MPPDDEGKEYYVLSELKRLNDCYNRLDEKLDRVCIDIAGLKVKAGMWGLVGGAIPIIIGLGVWVLKTS